MTKFFTTSSVVHILLPLKGAMPNQRSNFFHFFLLLVYTIRNLDRLFSKSYKIFTMYGEKKHRGQKMKRGIGQLIQQIFDYIFNVFIFSKFYFF